MKITKLLNSKILIIQQDKHRIQYEITKVIMTTIIDTDITEHPVDNKKNNFNKEKSKGKT